MSQFNASSMTWTDFANGSSSPPMMDANDDMQGFMEALDDLISEGQYIAVLKFLAAARFAIIFGGILGNTMTVMTFRRMGLDNGVMVAFYHLAVSDLGLTLVELVHSVALLCEFLEAELRVFFLFPPFFVAVLSYRLGALFRNVTAFLTTLLAVSKCLCVALPLHFQGFISRRRTILVVSLVWGYCLACTTANLATFQIRRFTIPGTNTSIFDLIKTPANDFIQVYIVDVVNDTIFNFACQVIVFVCVFVMFYALQKSVKFRQKTSANSKAITPNDNSSGLAKDFETKATDSAQGLPPPASKKGKERQVMRQVVLVCAVYILSNIINIIRVLLGNFLPGFTTVGKYRISHMLLYDMVILMPAINSSVNFLIYYKFNSRFRKMCFGKKQIE